MKSKVLTDDKNQRPNPLIDTSLEHLGFVVSNTQNDFLNTCSMIRRNVTKNHPAQRLEVLLKMSLCLAMLWALSLNPAQADDANNRVSVLHSGYVQAIEGRGFLPGAQDNGARKVASTISLVQGENIVLIADPGMAAPGVWDTVLARLHVKGVQPEDVTHVFISHHHPDHITQLGLFPNALLVDFWATYKDDVWSDHPDNFELAPGVKVIRTPGHTDEDASLLVETREGTYALTHLWWGPDYEPKEDPLAENASDIAHSRKLILKKADWIVPGHGDLFRNSKK